MSTFVRARASGAQRAEARKGHPAHQLSTARPSEAQRRERRKGHPDEHAHTSLQPSHHAQPDATLYHQADYTIQLINPPGLPAFPLRLTSHRLTSHHISALWLGLVRCHYSQ